MFEDTSVQVDAEIELYDQETGECHLKRDDSIDYHPKRARNNMLT